MSEAKVAFASQAWISEARTVLEELVATHGEPGVAFSACEIFTDAPPDVAASGTAAWSFHIDGKNVRVTAGETEGTDLLIRGDYAAALPGARLVITPEILAERAEQAPEPNPTSNVQGDMSNLPPYLLELHNRLAVRIE